MSFSCRLLRWRLAVYAVDVLDLVFVVDVPKGWVFLLWFSFGPDCFFGLLCVELQQFCARRWRQLA